MISLPEVSMSKYYFNIQLIQKFWLVLDYYEQQNTDKQYFSNATCTLYNNDNLKIASYTASYAPVVAELPYDRIFGKNSAAIWCNCSESNKIAEYRLVQGIDFFRN